MKLSKRSNGGTSWNLICLNQEEICPYLPREDLLFFVNNRLRKGVEIKDLGAFDAGSQGVDV